MLRIKIDEFYNEPNDDLIITPALVYGDAKYKDLTAKAIGLVWLRHSIMIVYYKKQN